MALLSLTLNSCASVSIKDHEYCGSLASKGATCFHDLTDASRDMNLEQFAVWWNDLSDPKICTNASTYADIKGDIEQLCSFNNVCTYEMQQNVEKISEKLDATISKASKWRKKK